MTLGGMLTIGSLFLLPCAMVIFFIGFSSYHYESDSFFSLATMMLSAFLSIFAAILGFTGFFLLRKGK